MNRPVVPLKPLHFLPLSRRLSATLLFGTLSLACEQGPASASPVAPISVAQAENDTSTEAPKTENMTKATSKRPSVVKGRRVDVRTQEYGRYSDAPVAPELGEIAPDFSVRLTGDSDFTLSEALAQAQGKPIAVVFYRGFW